MVRPVARLVHVLIGVASLSTCSTRTGTIPDAGADACAVLFGRPSDQTGLTSAQCGPACSCGGDDFSDPGYSDAFVASLISDWALDTPYPTLDVDPYLSAAPPDDPPDTVCGVLPTEPAGTHPRGYALVTYASEAAARAAGASPTHYGHCGVCSTLPDLAVYLRINDLTAPVRSCGLSSSTAEDDVACLQALGFDLPCAQIYAFNTAHTRSVCLTPCLAALGQPYNLPDGGLNDCLRCDESQSGPVFKGVAGRTRRNSGLANALCRPCSDVRPLLHDYR